jgi:hypothetical protein
MASSQHNACEGSQQTSRLVTVPQLEDILVSKRTTHFRRHSARGWWCCGCGVRDGVQMGESQRSRVCNLLPFLNFPYPTSILLRKFNKKKVHTYKKTVHSPLNSSSITRDLLSLSMCRCNLYSCLFFPLPNKHEKHQTTVINYTPALGRSVLDLLCLCVCASILSYSFDLYIPI